MADLVVKTRTVPKVARNKRIYPEGGATTTVVSSGGGGGAGHDPVTLGTANGLALSGQILSLGLGSGSVPGAISSTDWNRFNAKLDSFPGWDRLTLPTANDLQFDDNTNTFYFSTINGGQITAGNPAVFFGVGETGTMLVKNILTAPVQLSFTDTPGLWYISFPYNSVIPVCDQNLPPATNIPLVYFYNDGTGITIRHFNPYPATVPAVALARFQRDGAMVYSGFNLFATKLPTGDPSSSGVNTCVSLSPGVILEGNLYYQVLFQSPASNYWSQDLGFTSGITTANAGTFRTIYYNAVGILQKTAMLRFPFPNNGTQICFYTAYGVLTPVPNQKFICAFIYVTQDWFPGEAVRVYTSPKFFDSVAQAREYSWEQLFMDLPSEAIPQQRELYQLIYEYKNNFAQEVFYAVLRDYIDLRTNRYSITSISSATVADVNVAITVPPSGYTSTNQQLMNSELAGRIAQGVTGSGTLNKLSKFDSTGKALTDSLLYDNGTNVSVGGTDPTRTLDVSGSFRLRTVTLQNTYTRIIVADDNGNVDYILKTSLSYTLPIASLTVLGGVKVGNNLTIDSNGVLSATDFSYTLPTATGSVLGGIKVGSGLSIDVNGVLSATGGGPPTIGDGTLNYLTKWTTVGTYLGNSQIMDDGNQVFIGGVTYGGSEKLDVKGNLALGVQTWRWRQGVSGLSTAFLSMNQVSLTQADTTDYPGHYWYYGNGDIRYYNRRGGNTEMIERFTIFNDYFGINVLNPDATLHVSATYGIKFEQIATWSAAPWVMLMTDTGLIYKMLKADLAVGGAYTLPPATGSVLGGIMVGSGLAITPEGLLSVTAGGSGTVTSVGFSAPAGEFTVQNQPITGAGVISLFWKVQPNSYYLGSPNGVDPPEFMAVSIYRLEALNFPSRLVGSRSDGTYLSEIELGSGLSMAGGVLSATGGGGSYTLPIASASVLGGIKIGSGLAIAGDGTVSVTTGGVGTVTSVGISMPGSEYEVLYSPITGAGIIQVSWLGQNGGKVFASPKAIQSNGTPAFRQLALTDFEPLGAVSRLIGSDSQSTGIRDIILGDGLTMTENTLSASAGSSLVDSDFPNEGLMWRAQQAGAYNTVFPGRGLTITGATQGSFKLETNHKCIDQTAVHFQNSGTGEETAYSFGIPASSINYDGDTITILYTGLYQAGQSGVKHSSIIVNGSRLLDLQTPNSTVGFIWQIELTMVRRNSSELVYHCLGLYGPNGINGTYSNGVLSGLNFGTAIGLNFTVQGPTSGSVITRFATVNLTSKH